MKISIITTVYKAEQDLPRLLDSMMALKSPQLEFFLIDNGSPDRCGEICADYARKDPRFTVFTLKDNIGYIRARNLGIERCRGDYIGFCDSDDFLEPGGYDKAVEIISETGCDVYLATYCTVRGSEPTRAAHTYREGLYCGDAIQSELLPQAFGTINGKPMLHGFVWKHIYRRALITEKGIRFKESLKPYEDQIFNIDVLKCCDSVYAHDSVIYNYVVNAQSITVRLFQNFDAEAEWQRIFGLYQEKLQRATTEEQHTAICNQGLLNIYALALNMAKSRRKRKLLAAQFRAWQEEPMFGDVACRANAADGTRLKFVRWSLKHHNYSFMLFVIRTATRIKKG